MKQPFRFFLIFLFIILYTAGQTQPFTTETAAGSLADVQPTKTDYTRRLNEWLETQDSTRSVQFLNRVKASAMEGNGHFQVRFACLWAQMLYYRNIYHYDIAHKRPPKLLPTKKQMRDLLSSALSQAYQTEDEYLIAFASMWYATLASGIGDLGPAIMYSKNGIDLYEKLSFKIYPLDYQVLAEQLYKVREYAECINYAKKAAAAWERERDKSRPVFAGAVNVVNCLNTVALSYHRLGRLDSALAFYQQALQLATNAKETVWVGIISGNVGQLLYAQGKYDQAYQLLQQDYQTSKKEGLYDNAANSLQWAARIDLAFGRTSDAFRKIREAFALLKVLPGASYLRNTCYAAAQTFKKAGVYDSAFHYQEQYAALNDSLEKIVVSNSLAISSARLSDERSRYDIQNLNRERRTQLLYRNVIIAAILALAVIAALVVNRRLLRQKFKTEKAEQEKERLVQDVALAQEQLKLFTENITEKTRLIEELEQQATVRETSAEQQAVLADLTRQSILTEDDWQRFRLLFEKIYPLFFINLATQASDITLAEQRMAALMRLRLTARHIAALLGISPNSVYKTKQRLRQRFNLESDSQVEALLSRF